MDSRKRSFVLKHADNFRANYYKALGVPGRSEAQLRSEVEECLKGPFVDRPKLLSLVEQFGTPAACRGAVWKVVLCVLPEAVNAWDFASQQNSDEFYAYERCWRLCTATDAASYDAMRSAPLADLLIFVKVKMQGRSFSEGVTTELIEKACRVFEEALEGCTKAEQFLCVMSFFDALAALASSSSSTVFTAALVEEKLERLPDFEQLMYRMLSSLRATAWRL